jgi:hypothetical protein
MLGDTVVQTWVYVFPAYPVWRPWRRCEMAPHRFALAPGESCVFQHDVPAARLAAAAGPGRYYFTAWVAGSPSVTLAAGDVDVGH